MQIVFSLFKKKIISEEVDHKEALKVYIFKKMRSHCIEHPIQGTVQTLYRNLHRNAALRRYVLALHHQHHTQRFKTKARALYEHIRANYNLHVDAVKYALNILCNNDYIVSTINNETVLLIFDSVDTKLCAELGMIVADGLSFDLARYLNEDGTFDVRKAAGCFKYQSASFNRMLRNMFDVFTPLTIIRQYFVLADHFLNSFAFGITQLNLTLFAFHESFDRFVYLVNNIAVRGL